MIWDMTTGKLLNTLHGHNSWVTNIAFSRDGTHLASAGNDNAVIVWEMPAGRQVRKLSHSSTVWRAIFNPDGGRLATCSDDGTIKVWEAATGIEILTLRGHTTTVSCLSFSPDGTRLASGSHDGTIRILDARPLTPDAKVEAQFEREALGRLDFLFSKPLRKADVLDYLGNATGITPQARQMALALVDRYREETDPERYHQASWAVARQPYLNNFQYRFALQQAQTACQLAPGHGLYMTTLGAAQYRARDYKAALETLTKAEQLHRAMAAGLALPPTPYLALLTTLWQADQLRQAIAVNLAFLAMTQHHLGQKEQVQGTLARLREAVLQAQWNKDEESHHLVREAEGLIEEDGTKR